MRHFYVGLFVILTLCVLGYYTLFMADVALFGNQQQVKVQFESAGGLREGDSVLLAGRRTGRVMQITYDANAPLERRITATLTLEEEIVLRQDYVIQIVESTALGGRQVTIEPGDPAAPQIALAAPLTGNVAPGLFDALGNFGDALSGEDGVGDLLAKLNKIVGDLESSDAAGNLSTSLANFEKASADIAELTDGLSQGKGTLGALFQAKDFYDTWFATGEDLGKAAEDVQGIIGDARTGDGIVAAALNDPQLAEDGRKLIADASSSFDNINAVTADLKAGKGLIGRFLSDEDTADSGANIVANIEKVSADLANGTGTVGRLFTSDELYQNVNATFASAAKVAKDLEDGKGTLGQLISDDDLMREITLAVETLTRSLEDFREAAPVTTLTSVLFSAF
jgi:phospholipid/cholesterol/gamma-HCH transport system substrate-binding protein